MKKALILMGRYLPGYKDGGPVRTIINLTDALGDEYDFRIVCLDRDHGDTKPYCNIQYDKWNQIGKAMVWYVKQEGFTFALIKKLAEDVDTIYSCGFYDSYGYKTLLLNRLGKLKGKKIVVASMGTFSEGAFSHKHLKKKLFLDGCKLLGLFKNIIWSVTSKLELADVQKNVGSKAECIIAEDLPRTNVPGFVVRERNDAILKIVFLSRICPIKNLLGAIKSLEQVRCQVEFTIYGPLEDVAYWMSCKLKLEKLPENIRWRYEGHVPSEAVQEILQQHDIFLFPTKGENYGHVIFEALSVGCIPVISDQTPWGFIVEKNAGCVLPLSDEMTNFAKAIEQLNEIGTLSRVCMADHAVQVAKEKVEQAKKETGYRIIFG